ncbi:MAG: 2-amino-4-hydroxy-6-hydroxymethyldihydropteridine diphosphokinase [Gammaproteobacteria bacterium]|nr:2-amino-4-hydroxy-6-hydroxymethyldihydropteridine diphosphokinase [Gammaproteobacteria bacterium]MCP4091105.1 2-amino-4-hydroxy-6-hydroxymethyldihydropteridine diphosphokinase [Gammaproteobacteria bacterium]MCP4277369.1 2-amino-4-hydroxy-6-hydroxymethyldihydropteridine diphosphokinase [Gammaproteobacteria bacterium]MCP4831570.1 2-amino-4-hydroxy-6-hydroxymethyldihydropteridine diphosphokinase [Gammaproteobacteria bacterium]MCP4927793.1 2-amino-4-hydroxy-6-hydroxymethyldihydropteridine diphos
MRQPSVRSDLPSQAVSDHELSDQGLCQHWVPVYVGLGSNLNEPSEQVALALRELEVLPNTRLVAVSGLYGNPPMGPQDQPDYINAVAGLLTRKTAMELLLLLQSLEHQLGRVRSEGDRWGPRIIDLDLLVYGQSQISVPGLNLPHPGILERNFVLFPLRDIAPSLMVPGQGVVSTLAQQVGAVGLQQIKE